MKTLELPAISIIVPTLNEAVGLGVHLAPLQPLRRRGAEVIVVDGGSSDDTTAQAAPYADLVITAGRGRAAQMNTGASRAQARILLFLHADSRLPDSADRLITDGLDSHGGGWGRFDIAIDGRHALFPVIAWCMNLRSRFTGIATGDQAMFVVREVFQQAGGFTEIPLMEDIELSRRLKRSGPPLCLRDKVVTSGRRWEKGGVLRTVVLMWRLRLGYYLGRDPARLAVEYGYAPPES